MQLDIHLVKFLDMLYFSGDFLNILCSRLSASNPAESTTIVPAIWTLVENSQKAKMVFKAAGLDLKMKDYLRVLYLNNYSHVSDRDVELLRHVLNLLSDN